MLTDSRGSLSKSMNSVIGDCSVLMGKQSFSDQEPSPQAICVIIDTKNITLLDRCVLNYVQY